MNKWVDFAIWASSTALGCWFVWWAFDVNAQEQYALWFGLTAGYAVLKWEWAK